jgi:hypothetical protein
VGPRRSRQKHGTLLSPPLPRQQTRRRRLTILDKIHEKNHHSWGKFSSTSRIRYNV